MLYRIYAPGRWWDDMQSPMESWRDEMERGDDIGSGAEVVNQYFDGQRSVKRGRGWAHRFDLDVNGVTFLRGEAKYRFNLHSDNIAAGYGDEWDRSCRDAAKSLLARCDAILKEI